MNTGTAELIATTLALTESVKELTHVVKGLTGVLIEDREAHEPDEETQEAAATTYMDGSPRG